MNVLVTGGAGYIGSHATRRLRAGGHHVAVIDNLYRGHRQAVPDDVPFIEADLRRTDRVEAALRQHDVQCVMHFAALAYVGESVARPLDYYDNNVAGSVSLLRAMDNADVRRLVFSSTCATYGQPPPQSIPIHEACPQAPINPYGRSKLAIEHLLADYAAANPDFAYAALRYFNVAGCASDGSIGEDHHPETHLIPVLLNVALGKLPEAVIFGDDYPTPDGTCIRDYIHVEDLVDAHVAVMEALLPGDQRIYNLGTGRGTSVKQILQAARDVTGRPIPADIGPRRPGDPPQLFADPAKIKNELGWQAQRNDIHQMIADAWNWFQNHPEGYTTSS